MHPQVATLSRCPYWFQAFVKVEQAQRRCKAAYLWVSLAPTARIISANVKSQKGCRRRGRHPRVGDGLVPVQVGGHSGQHQLLAL